MLFDSYYPIPTLDAPQYPGFGMSENQPQGIKPMEGAKTGIVQPVNRLLKRSHDLQTSFLRQKAEGFRFIAPIKGAFSTYRVQSLHPTLRLCWSLIAGPIKANKWVIERAPEVDDADSRLIQDMFIPQRRKVILHGLNSLRFGFVPFEKVWTTRSGVPWLSLKPFFPDGSLIWKDKNTDAFAGLTPGWLVNRNDDTYDGTKPYLPANKSMIITNEPEASDLYGYSRNDAAYDDWCDSMVLRLRRTQLDRKLAGILVTGHYPLGQSPYKGVMVDNQQIMADQVNNLVDAGAWLAPSLVFDLDDDEEGDGAGLKNDPELLVKLAEASLWNIDIEDAGNYSAAVSGFIAEEAYIDKRLFRAYERPERTGMEGEHGTKAESGQHSDNSVTDSEDIDLSIAEQVSQQAIDDVMMYRHGPNGVGKVWIKPSPLAPKKIGYKTDLIKAAMQQNTPASLMFLHAIKMGKVLQEYDFELSTEGWDDKAMTALLKKFLTAPMPDQGGPSESTTT